MNLSPSIPTTTPPPNPAALRRWILAFCIIRFDLEQGQVVEECYPANSLTPDHQLTIAFSSFPDSTSHHHNPSGRSSIHDSIFSFRLPSPDGFIYAYAFNRHRLDPRLPRGGDQKSVVVLSRSPYSSVFRPLLQILAPLCFDIGRNALEVVASHVAAWPSPAPGRDVELPIGGAALRARLPLADDDPAAFNDADLFVCFRGVILQLWTLWELMIVGEPMLVIAPTPTECSEAVVALVGLLAPIECSVDFRPYFTIHDPDFGRLNSIVEGEEFPPMVLGVTNFFFLKALRGIRHVVSVGSPSTGQISRPVSPLSLLNAVKRRREGPSSLMNAHKEAVWSSYRPVTKPDTAILNRLVDAGVSQRIDESMSVVNNEILRRHFVELTTNFLAPFGPYLRAITPLETSSVFDRPPALPAFKADEFLGSLAARGPGKFLSKRMRSNWLDLYRRFLEGKNFVPWFQKRRAVAEKERRRLWRQARMRADIQTLISRMSELETVDCFNAIEQHLLAEIQSADESIDSSATCCKLKADLRSVFKVLPKDLQELLLANPKRASLLHASSESPKLPGHPSIPGLVLHETKLSFLSL